MIIAVKKASSVLTACRAWTTETEQRRSSSCESTASAAVPSRGDEGPRPTATYWELNNIRTVRVRRPGRSTLKYTIVTARSNDRCEARRMRDEAVPYRRDPLGEKAAIRICGQCQPVIVPCSINCSLAVCVSETDSPYVRRSRRSIETTYACEDRYSRISMGRAPCCDKERVKRGPWAPEEDEQLRSYVRTHGIGGNWIALPHKAGLNRCGKSCRLRWLNYLRPDIRHGGYTDHEDRVIYSLYASIGSRWSIIASKLPGRTDNDVKNYWNTKLKKKYHGGHASLGVGASFSAPATPPAGSGSALSWSQAQCAPSRQPAAHSPSASASSSVDTGSSGGDMCFPAAAAAMYQPPHTELAAVPNALLDDAFLADLGAYGDLLFGGLLQEDDKAAVGGLELSSAACYFPSMEMWAGDAKPQQGLCNAFT